MTNRTNYFNFNKYYQQTCFLNIYSVLKKEAFRNCDELFFELYLIFFYELEI